MNIIKFISSRQSWSIPYTIFAAIFVVLPLLLIVVFAFTDENGALTLYNFQSQFVSQMNLLFMNILLITIPPLLVFIFFNRQIVSGMTKGAVKG